MKNYFLLQLFITLFLLNGCNSAERSANSVEYVNLIHDAPDSPESSLIGGPIQDNADKCASANPITYIDSSDPPFLIFHGTADPLVPYCQSEKLFEALLNMNVPSQFVLVPEAKHGQGLFEEKYYNMMTSFFLSESKKK